MTPEEFNKLDEDSKNVLIFEAKKVAEREEGSTRFQLFKIDNFFIEAKISLQEFKRRCLTTYNSNDLPLNYHLNF
jgi:hypothetical protein